MDAFRRSLNNEIAWFAMLVDAKDERARSFYERYGFMRFVDRPGSLFLPRRTIETLLL
jgi:hypothetical protein